MTSQAGDGMEVGVVPSRPIWLRAAMLYLSIFLLAGVVFGLFSLATTSSAARGLESGVVFGGFMSAVLGSIAVARQRGNRESWSPRRRDLIHMTADAHSARNQVLIAFDFLGARITEDNLSHLRARTGVGIHSWGSWIDIHFSAIPTAITLDIRVKPVVPATLIDYGAAQRILDVLRFYTSPMPR